MQDGTRPRLATADYANALLNGNSLIFQLMLRAAGITQIGDFSSCNFFRIVRVDRIPGALGISLVGRYLVVAAIGGKHFAGDIILLRYEEFE